MTIRQKDIAKELGISRSLVAHALAGNPRVSEVTRLKISDLATKLGYSATTNTGARAMAAKRNGKSVATEIVAVLIPMQTEKERGTGPFIDEMLTGIEQEADERALDIYMCAWRSGRRFPRLIADQGVDGLICIGHPQDWVSSVERAGLPTVSFFSAGVTAESWDTARILVDDFGGTKQMVEYLVSLGHRRIAYLGQIPSFGTAAARLAGYRAGLAEAGIEADESLIEANIYYLKDSADSFAALRSRSSDWTALVCYNDLIAMKSVTALQEQGIVVPRDVSVAGFDNLSVQQNFPVPITSMSFDRTAMGRRAVEIVCEAAERRKLGLEAGPLVTDVFAVELVVQQSTSLVQPRQR